MAYVKYSDISDSIARITTEIESEPDTNERTDLVVAFVKAISDAAGSLLERQVYDLKMLGEPSDIIAIQLGISQRAVLRMIRRRSQETGLNPLEKTTVDQWFDIRNYIDL